jgi:hypothetical protein
VAHKETSTHKNTIVTGNGVPKFVVTVTVYAVEGSSPAAPTYTTHLGRDARREAMTNTPEAASQNPR